MTQDRLRRMMAYGVEHGFVSREAAEAFLNPRWGRAPEPGERAAPLGLPQMPEEIFGVEAIPLADRIFAAGGPGKYQQMSARRPGTLEGRSMLASGRDPAPEPLMLSPQASPPQAAPRTPGLGVGPDPELARIARDRPADPSGYRVAPDGTVMRWNPNPTLPFNPIPQPGRAPPRDALIPVSPGEKQRFMEGLTGANQSYPPGLMSPEEARARDKAGANPLVGMTTSLAGANFIREAEGLGLKQYPSHEGGSDTVGYGHKIMPGEDFSRGLTKPEADELFRKDLAKHQAYVLRHIAVPLTQAQFDALTSLAYTSPQAFWDPESDLRNKLNAGDYAGAAKEFARWNMVPETDKNGNPIKVDGKRVMKVSPGLTRRRAAEQRMFETGTYDLNP